MFIGRQLVSKYTFTELPKFYGGFIMFYSSGVLCQFLKVIVNLSFVEDTQLCRGHSKPEYCVQVCYFYIKCVSSKNTN